MRQLKFVLGFWLVSLSVIFLYVMNAEYLYDQKEKTALFKSYLQRASDPQEKSLRLVSSSHTSAERNYKYGQGRIEEATLELAEDKSILKIFKKTYKLILKRKKYPGNSDADRIEASLRLTIDYRVQKDFMTIFGKHKIMPGEEDWEMMNSLIDNPVNKVKMKIR